MDQKLLLLEEKVIVLLNKLKDNHLQIQKFESEMITLQEQHKDLQEKHVISKIIKRSRKTV